MVKRHIHTTIEENTKNQLLKYGNGNLQAGIELVVSLSDDKVFNIKTEMERIAMKILSEREDLYNTNNLFECVIFK